VRHSCTQGGQCREEEIGVFRDANPECNTEKFADLMAKEFGVTSKPVAKLLMESIEAWRKDGIEI
jgi:hypothetical protein